MEPKAREAQVDMGEIDREWLQWVEAHESPGFIQASMSKIQGLFRTSKDYPTVFKG